MKSEGRNPHNEALFCDNAQGEEFEGLGLDVGQGRLKMRGQTRG